MPSAAARATSVAAARRRAAAAAEETAVAEEENENEEEEEEEEIEEAEEGTDETARSHTRRNQLAAAVSAAKATISACDQSAAVYKAALRALGDESAAAVPGTAAAAAAATHGGGGGGGSAPSAAATSANSVSVQWLKVEGLPEASAPPKLRLQLSSPVENVDLLQVGDTVQFVGVETGQATLTVTAVALPADADHDDDDDEDHGGAPLPSAEVVCDLSTYTHQLLDAVQPAPLYESVVPLRMNQAGAESDTDAADTAAAVVVTLKFSYRPSVKDQREELYEQIAKVALVKGSAREDLRKASIVLHQLQLAASPSSQSSQMTTGRGGGRAAAMQPGFLLKGETAPKAAPKWKVWYERGAIVLPVAKNYLLFLGFVLVSHWYGPHLAIPAPW